MGQILSILLEVFFSLSLGTMAKSPPGPSDSVSDGSLFQNSVYIGINIENILYGEFRDTYHEKMQTFVQALSCSSTLRPYVSC